MAIQKSTTLTGIRIMIQDLTAFLLGFTFIFSEMHEDFCIVEIQRMQFLLSLAQKLADLSLKPQ